MPSRAQLGGLWHLLLAWVAAHYTRTFPSLALVHRVATAAGLEAKVSPHTFRRSCATELIRGGANLYHVKELLGHESLDTLRHYVKLTINDLKKTQEKCHPREKDD